MTQQFQNILLLGRPASGKSEFIEYMKQQNDADRAAKYHIGPFREMDDFPWLWQKFMEDNIWEAAGYPRQYSFGGSNPGLSKEGAPLFDYCMAKFNEEYVAFTQAHPDYYTSGRTLFIEFARGGPEAYAKALHQLSPEILKRSVILFVLVSYEESCRRNTARYREKLKHSILAHKCHDETMTLFYKTHDWLELTQNQVAGRLTVHGISLPFVTMHNDPELTDPVLLDRRYAPALERLWEAAHVPI